MRTKTLEILDLSNNRIKGDGGFALSVVIKENTFLKTLYLGMNKIDDANCARIIKALSSNNYLEILDLSTNNAGELSAYALDVALKQNCTIKTIDLSHNNFNLVENLFNTIISNPSLTKLDIRNTKISENEIEKIEKALVKKEVQLMRTENYNNLNK
jgi:hypothetical protein